MGKSDNDDARPSRKRRLNVIFFVDAAKTRSFSMPLGRLNLVLVLVAALIVWSGTSAVALVWLAKDRWDAAERVRAALATIFEYETRHDHVYDVAYPSGSKVARPSVASEGPAKNEAPKAQSESSAPSGSSAASTSLSAKAAPPASTEKDPGSVAAAELAAPAVAATVAAAAPAAADAAADAVAINVSNPVLEAGANSIELRFDLTSKDGKLAEGYLWAVAEFRNDADGKTLYIGAPQSIEPGANGEPAHPQRSAIFSIRRQKKKSFSFKLAKGQTGTFTSVKIGVMDKSGQKRTTYNVPVDIKIAQSG